MYDDTRVSYSQLMTAAPKAECEQEDKGIDDASLKATQTKEDEIIFGLQEQITQLRATIQQPQKKHPLAISIMATGWVVVVTQWGEMIVTNMTKARFSVITVRGWGHIVHECPSAP